MFRRQIYGGKRNFNITRRIWKIRKRIRLFKNNKKSRNSWKNKLRYAKIIDESEIDTKTVQVGNIVTLHDEEFDENVTYTIVGSTEVNLEENKISNESPIGAALLGKKKNDIVEIKVPVGTVKYKILSIKK